MSHEHPGTGYPYAQDTPTATDYVRTVRVVCAYPLNDDGSVSCRNTSPCPIHRGRRIGETPAEARERQETEDLLNGAVPEGSPDPAKGLHELISGDPLPEFAELRERYGDPQDLKPIPRYDPNAPADLHDQLHKDDQPWSVRSRLAVVLGRRALATRLADALPPLLGAELADRLDTLVTQAITEHDAQVTQDMSDHYFAVRSRLDAEVAAKLEELRRERYKPTRLD